MRPPNFVDERSRRHFRYGAVIGLCIAMAALTAEHLGGSNYVVRHKRGVLSDRLAGGDVAGVRAISSSPPTVTY